MATIDARLQRVEDRLQVNADRLQELVELLNGGPSCEWDRSVRGRLHKLQSDAAAARAAAEALAVIRATEDRTLSRNEKRAAIAFGFVQALVTLATLLILLMHG